METFNNWNLTLGKELIKVPARVLPIERISCNNSQYDGGKIAEWSRNVRSLPMFTSVVMKRWIIITPNVHNIDPFVSNLQSVGRSMAFTLPQPQM